MRLEGPMEELRAGTENLARFVLATVGRKGHSRQIRGGCVVACTHNVQNPYFTAAIRTESDVNPHDFLADSQLFFGALKRPFKIWVPTDDPAMRSAAAEIGAVPDASSTPAMIIRRPIRVDAARYKVRVSATPEMFDHFGQIAEAGYESPGLGWLLRDQDNYAAPGSMWATAYDGDTPVGVACGYLSGSTGGVYFVATPPEHRGKQVGTEVTQWVVNALFERGAECVTLQSSQIGLPVYEKLGFRVCGHYERFAAQAPAS